VGAEGVSDDALVGTEDLSCSGVAEALGEGCGALHVGEEDCAECASFRRLTPRCRLLTVAQELVDGSECRLRIA